MTAPKKLIAALLAMLVFTLVTVVFVFAFKDTISVDGWFSEESEREVIYHRPLTEPTKPVETQPEIQPTEETETVPVETQPETQPTEETETVPVETLPPKTEPVIQRIHYEKVPLYDQTQYPDIRYRSGTLATSGSNITSLAMVASYLTGYEYMPDELASYFANYIGNSMQWLEYASDELKLPWKRAVNIDEAIQALRDGKIAIAVMGEKSLFMESQHFVVFAGITEDGKILVNDPYSPDYEKWNLKNALVSGFRRTDLSGSYSGAWIYDPGLIPEEPFIYEPVPNTDAYRYPGIELSDEDKELLARLICAEGESEPFEGQQAIAEVILNRLAADNFPDTIKGIIYAEGQFLGAQNLYLTNPTHTQYEAVERALNGPYVVPVDVVFFSQYAVNDKVWGTIGAHVFCHQW